MNKAHLDTVCVAIHDETLQHEGTNLRVWFHHFGDPEWKWHSLAFPIRDGNKEEAMARANKALDAMCVLLSNGTPVSLADITRLENDVNDGEPVFLPGQNKPFTLAEAA